MRQLYTFTFIIPYDMSNQYKNFEANTAVLQEENLEMLRELRSLYELHISLLREAVSLKEALVTSNHSDYNPGKAL